MLDLIAFVLLLALLAWWFRGYWPTWRRAWRTARAVVSAFGQARSLRGAAGARGFAGRPSGRPGTLRVVDVTPRRPEDRPN